MSSSDEVLNFVRTRAKYACEYCDVSETDSGGRLTIDHYQPQSQGGSDDLNNLVYCCVRCNLYKHDYWPKSPTESSLWNPRVDPPTKHIIEADDGKLHPLTKVGEFTIARLRLNRPQLISHRIQRQNLTDEDALLRQLKSYLSLYEHLTKQQQLLIEEQQQLLKAQQDLINQIIDLS